MRHLQKEEEHFSVFHVDRGDGVNAQVLRGSTQMRWWGGEAPAAPEVRT